MQSAIKPRGGVGEESEALSGLSTEVLRMSGRQAMSYEDPLRNPTFSAHISGDSNSYR